MAKIDYILGDEVLVTHRTTLLYDDDGTRVPVVSKCEPPIKATVVGAVNRPLGKYVAGTGYGYSGMDVEDYSPPYLKVDGTITLIQCKARLFGKVIEAQVQHVRPKRWR